MYSSIFLPNTLFHHLFLKCRNRATTGEQNVYSIGKITVSENEEKTVGQKSKNKFCIRVKKRQELSYLAMTETF